MLMLYERCSGLIGVACRAVHCGSCCLPYKCALKSRTVFSLSNRHQILNFDYIYDPLSIKINVPTGEISHAQTLKQNIICHKLNNVLLLLCLLFCNLSCMEIFRHTFIRFEDRPSYLITDILECKKTKWTPP